MIIVSPSLLSCNFLNLEKEIKAFDGINNIWFHLDIMDGHFVPNLTFGHPIVKQLSKITEHKLDAHFMVTNPDFYINTFSKFNIHNFTFHRETMNDDKSTLELIKKGKAIYPSIGISIRPRTPVSQLSDEILKAVDLVLMMSVEPGFGGQTFIPETYSKLKELQARKGDLSAKFQIQADGGIDDTIAPKLIKHGVSNLVAGSYIFRGSESQYDARIEKLRIY